MFHVLRGGSENSKFSQFQFFPKLGTRWGVVKFQIFPKFKKVQIILGEGGGVKKIVDFFHFLGLFFFLIAPLSEKIPDIEEVDSECPPSYHCLLKSWWTPES